MEARTHGPDFRQVDGTLPRVDLKPGLVVRQGGVAPLPLEPELADLPAIPLPAREGCEVVIQALGGHHGNPRVHLPQLRELGIFPRGQEVLGGIPREGRPGSSRAGELSKQPVV